MEKLFIGMDGGGTRTRALLFDYHGLRQAIAESGGCNLSHGNEMYVTQVLNEAVDAASEVWRERYHEEFDRTRVEALFLGSAGFSAEKARLRLLDCFRIRGMDGIDRDVRSDMYTTLVGGLEGKPGISIIVGTGSACLAENANAELCQTGGWECFVADEGSGYDIGRKGIIAAVRMADGRLETTPLKDAIFNALGIKETAEIVDRVHQPPISKAEVASFATHVFQAAEAGDVQAQAILKNAAEEIALLAETSHHRLPTGFPPQVALVGGTLKCEYYRRLIFDAIRARLPESGVFVASLPPVVGAGILAVKLSGNPVPNQLIERFRETFGNKIV